MVMAIYAHCQDIADFEGDWYSIVILVPLNGKLYIGAQELSRDDGWNQINRTR